MPSSPPLPSSNQHQPSLLSLLTHHQLLLMTVALVQVYFLQKIKLHIFKVSSYSFMFWLSIHLFLACILCFVFGSLSLFPRQVWLLAYPPALRIRFLAQTQLQCSLSLILLYCTFNKDEIALSRADCKHSQNPHCQGELPAPSLLLIFQLGYSGVVTNHLAFTAFSTEQAKSWLASDYSKTRGMLTCNSWLVFSKWSLNQWRKNWITSYMFTF